MSSNNPFAQPLAQPAPQANASGPSTATAFKDLVSQHATAFETWADEVIASSKTVDRDIDTLHAQSYNISQLQTRLEANNAMKEVIQKYSMGQDMVGTATDATLAVLLAPLSILYGIYAVTDAMVDRAEIALDDKDTQAKRNTTINSRQSDVASFETALNDDYTAGVNRLKTIYQTEKQGINNDASLDPAAKTTKLTELKAARDYALAAYEGWQRERVKTAEAACNATGYIEAITQGKAANLGANGMHIDPTFQLPARPVKDGESLIVDVSVSIKRARKSSGSNPEVKQNNVRVDAKKGDNGMYFEIPDLKNIVTESKLAFWSNPTTPQYRDSSKHSGVLVRRMYLAAFDKGLAQDPNMPIDIFPILLKFNTLKERQQFIDDMVRTFGNIPMGIEDHPQFRPAKDASIIKYGCNVKINFGQGPAATNISSSTPPSLQQAASSSGAPSTVTPSTPTTPHVAIRGLSAK